MVLDGRDHVLLVCVARSRRAGPARAGQAARIQGDREGIVRRVPAPSLTRWPSTNPPSEATVTATLREAGLRPSAWSSGPGDRYTAHSHSYHKVLYCARGSIRFDLPGSGGSFYLNSCDP